MPFELLQYDFILRGFSAGIIIALVAPLIGIFLVLRRYSLIADTLSHVSLAGIAIGLLTGINPFFTAIVTTVAASTVIERLRFSRKIYGESALALFLSGSLALAVVLLGLAHGLTANLFNYLFGSIVTVTSSDIQTMLGLALVVTLVVGLLYKELVYVSFDEESATVSGVRTKLVNTIFIILAATSIALAIPVVGVLLISALLVIPTITALQFRRPIIPTIVIAQVISVFSVIAGLLLSYYLNLAPGGTIVLITLGIFFIVELSSNL